MYKNVRVDIRKAAQKGTTVKMPEVKWNKTINSRKNCFGSHKRKEFKESNIPVVPNVIK